MSIANELIVFVFLLVLCIGGIGERNSRKHNIFAPSSSHALRHSAKRHMLAQEVENGENSSILLVDHSKFHSDSLVHISGGLKTESNRTTPSSMSTEGSLSDPCHTDGNCDSLNAVCLKCGFNYSCVYGEDVNVTCEVKNETKCKVTSESFRAELNEYSCKLTGALISSKDCSFEVIASCPCGADVNGLNSAKLLNGNRTFIKTHNCRYCYQTPYFEHVCQINTSCHVVSAPRQGYITKCIVKTHVLCLGNRVFAKHVPCNWTKGYSWGTALLLSIVFGGFGVDRFYLGMWQEGIGKLFSFGGLGVWTLVDVILIATGYLGPADHSLYIRN